MEKQYYNNKVRDLEITTSSDNMLAYISIKYIDEIIKENIQSAFYTASDIRSELTSAGIIFGIIDIEIEKYGLSNCVNQIIARGKSCVEPIDDKITINFNIEKNSNNLVEEANGNIDFKSIGSIQAVHTGDVIALHIKGSEGIDGCDVFGHEIVSKLQKNIKLKVSSGCKVVDGDKVVASINGKLCVKDDTFCVHKLHEISGDVDIKTGNIKFIGDIVIYGSVKENMRVDCGNCIKIYKDIERAVVKSQNNIEIIGNVITSKIVAGGEDVTRGCGINDLKDIKQIIKNIISEIKKIRKFNLISEDKKDGEIIKVLIENNHRNLTRLCIRTIAFLNMEKSLDSEEALATVFRDKLIFFGPINIMNYKELEITINLIDKKLAALNEFALHPVEVKVSYSQDSKIESTGNIILTGKGEYVSEIISNDGVYFTDLSSVTRGGCITSKNEIKCANVGSNAFVRTILKVESGGHIWIDMAFPNTKLIIGRREYIFNTSCKNIHAYLGKDGEIIVNRLNLLEV